jgi:uroporphyrinogen-III synthase
MDPMSLHDRRILITRPKEQAGKVLSEIRRLGGTAALVPMISINPPLSWQDCDGAIARLQTYDAIAFTSANAVRSFLGRVDHRLHSRRSLNSLTVYAIGKGTAAALRTEGISHPLVGAMPTGAGLAEILHDGIVSRRVLIPQSDIARGELGRTLRHRGVIVDEVTVYRTGPPDHREVSDLPRRVLAKEFDAAVFFSPSAVTNFLDLFSGIPASVQESLAFAVIGPTTREAMIRRGITPNIMAVEPSARGVAEALDAYFC